MLRVEGVEYNFKGHHQEIHKGHWKGPQKNLLMQWGWWMLEIYLYDHWLLMSSN
jgi:hypothetical protein